MLSSFTLETIQDNLHHYQIWLICTFLVAVVNATGGYLSLMFNKTLKGIRSHLHETIFLLVVALASLTFLMYPVVGLIGEVFLQKVQNDTH